MGIAIELTISRQSVGTIFFFVAVQKKKVGGLGKIHKPLHSIYTNYGNITIKRNRLLLKLYKTIKYVITHT
jgi:hypothetical protein